MSDDFLDQAFASDEAPTVDRRKTGGIVYLTVADPNQNEETKMAIAARENEMVERVPVIFIWDNDRWDLIGFGMDGADGLAELTELLGRKPTLQEAELFQENIVASIYEEHEPLILAAEMSS